MSSSKTHNPFVRVRTTEYVTMGTPFNFPLDFVELYFPTYGDLSIQGNPDRVALENFADWVVADSNRQRAILPYGHISYTLECKHTILSDLNRIIAVLGAQGSGKTRTAISLCLALLEQLKAPIVPAEHARRLLGMVAKEYVPEKGRKFVSALKAAGLNPSEVVFSPSANIYNSIKDCRRDIRNSHPFKIHLIDDPRGHRNIPGFKTAMLSLYEAFDKLREKKLSFFVTGVRKDMFPMESIFELMEVRFRSPHANVAHVIKYRRASANDIEFVVYGYHKVPHPDTLITPDLTGCATPAEFFAKVDEKKLYLMDLADGTSFDLSILQEFRDYFLLSPDFATWSATESDRRAAIDLSPAFCEADPSDRKMIERIWKSELRAAGCIIAQGPGKGRVEVEAVRNQQKQILTAVNAKLERAKKGDIFAQPLVLEEA